MTIKEVNTSICQSTHLCKYYWQIMVFKNCCSFCKLWFQLITLTTPMNQSINQSINQFYLHLNKQHRQVST